MRISHERSLCLFLVLILMSFFCSCVINKKNAIQRAFAGSQQHLGTGNYQEAINSCDAVYTKYPHETDAREYYIRTVEGMKTSADTAYDAKKYDLSEDIYSVLSQNFPKFKSFVKSLSFDNAYLSRKIRNCRIVQIEIQAQNAIATANFSGAIDMYKTSLKSYPDDALLREQYFEIVFNIYQVAERAQTENNYVTAGIVYSLLANRFQTLKKSIPSLPFTENSLKKGVRDCRSALTGKGLEKYRIGKLKEAIAVWEGILKFDPENIEIRNAIENAKVQLKKNKRLDMAIFPGTSGFMYWIFTPRFARHFLTVLAVNPGQRLMLPCPSRKTYCHNAVIAIRGRGVW